MGFAREKMAEGCDRQEPRPRHGQRSTEPSRSPLKLVCDAFSASW
jgi:hypothetical protein